MKVVINRCFGGFGLSDPAFEMLLDLKGIEWEKVIPKDRVSYGADYFKKGHLGDDDHYLWYWDLTKDRADKDLVQVVENLGDKANSAFSELKIVEIPDDIEWYVVEYDGMEHVAETHRTWS